MKMNNFLDATILKPEAKIEEYQQLCEDAIALGFPAVCIPPFMIEKVRKWLDGSSVRVATVIGFPTGYQTIPSKIYELRDAIDRGAKEIDYVVHRGYLANDDWENIEEETLAWIDICREKQVVSKWIIEASELSIYQKEKLLEIANKHLPNYVKTSTGVYGKAAIEDVRLFRKHLLPNIYIKAAGGISTREIAIDYIDAGANRLGVSQYRAIL